MGWVGDLLGAGSNVRKPPDQNEPMISTLPSLSQDLPNSGDNKMSPDSFNKPQLSHAHVPTSLFLSFFIRRTLGKETAPAEKVPVH